MMFRGIEVEIKRTEKRLELLKEIEELDSGFESIKQEYQGRREELMKQLEDFDKEDYVLPNSPKQEETQKPEEPVKERKKREYKKQPAMTKPLKEPVVPPKQKTQPKQEETPADNQEQPETLTAAEKIRAAINPADYTDIPTLVAGIQEKTGLTKTAIAEAIGLYPSDLSQALSGASFPYILKAFQRIGWPMVEPGKEYRTEAEARREFARGEEKQ